MRKWVFLSATIFICLAGLVHESVADTTEFFPFTEPTWTFPVNRVYFQTENDSLFYATPSIASGTGVAAYSGTQAGFDGVWEWETKKSGDGDNGQRSVYFFYAQLPDLNLAAHGVSEVTTTYVFEHGLPSPNENKWVLSRIQSTIPEDATSGTKISLATFSVDNSFDLNTWRQVKVSLKTREVHTNSASMIIDITAEVDGDVVMAITDSQIQSGTAVSNASSTFRIKAAAGYSTQRKYFRNIRYNGETTPIIPLTGPDSETILGLGSLTDAAFNSDGTKFSSYGGVGTLTWETESGALIGYASSSVEVTNFAFHPNDNWFFQGGSSSAANVRLIGVTSDDIINQYDGKFLAVSPNGNYVVTAKWQDAIVYNVDSGDVISILSGHSGEVTHAVFSSDSSKILTGSADGTAKYWYTLTGLFIHTLDGHDSGSTITDISITSDDASIVTAGSDGKIVVWNASTGASSLTFTDHTSSINDIEISPDDLKVVSGSDTGSLVWNVDGSGSAVVLDSTTVVQKVRFGTNVAFTSSVTDSVYTTKYWTDTGTLTTTYNGRLLEVDDDWSHLILDNKKDIELWIVGAPGSAEEVKSFDGHSDAIEKTIYSPDQLTVLTVAENGVLKLYDAFTGVEEARINALAGAFSPDSSKLLTGGEDDKARYWNISTGLPIFTLSGHTDDVVSVAVSSTGNRLLTGSNDQTARLWNANNGNFIAEMAGHPGNVIKVMFSNDNTRIITVSDNPTVFIWDSSGNLVTSISNVNFLAQNPAGTQILLGSTSDNTAAIYSLTDGSLVSTLSGHTAQVTSGDFSPTGSNVATGAQDNDVKIWSVSTGTLSKTLSGHTGAIISVDYSSDGLWVTSASEDETVKIWTVADGTAFRTFSTHTSEPNTTEISENLQFTLTSSDDGTGRIFSITSSGTDFTLSLVATNDLIIPGRDQEFTVQIDDAEGITSYRIVLYATGTVVTDGTQQTIPAGVSSSDILSGSFGLFGFTTTNTAASSWGTSNMTISAVTTNPSSFNWYYITNSRGSNSPLTEGEGDLLRFRARFPSNAPASTTASVALLIVDSSGTRIGTNTVTASQIEDATWTGTTESFLWGDIDADGTPGSSDADLILQYDTFQIDSFSGHAETRPNFPAEADVDGDGALGAQDADDILRFEAFLITKFDADTNGDGYGPETFSSKTASRRAAPSDGTKLLAKVVPAGDGSWLVNFSAENASEIRTMRLVVNYDASKYNVNPESIKWLVDDSGAKLVVNADIPGMLVASGILSNTLTSGPQNLMSVQFDEIRSSGSAMLRVDNELTRLNDGQIPIVGGDLVIDLSSASTLENTGIGDWMVH